MPASSFKYAVSTLRRRYSASDLVPLFVGAALGFAGNALYAERWLETVGWLAIGLFTIFSVIMVDRLRTHAEVEMTRTNSMLMSGLRKGIVQTHAKVNFVPGSARHANGSQEHSTSQIYDSATELVKQARTSILVIGDYSPPPQIGASFDSSPPAHRSEYLLAIEAMLRERAKDSNPEAPVLEYRRYIQRPVDVYERARVRDPMLASVDLCSEDMIGDEQALDHCERVLKIARSARQTSAERRISVVIKIIPFLPNCPSMLIVNKREIQFTIPERTDEPDDDKYAQQGLLGILAVEDMSGGDQIVNHFVNLFERLSKFSSSVISVDREVPQPASE